jgi:hypothetical protein
MADIMKYNYFIIAFILILTSPLIFTSSFTCLDINDVGNFIKQENKICVCILTEDSVVDIYCRYFKNNLNNSLESATNLGKEDDFNNNIIINNSFENKCNKDQIIKIDNKISNLKETVLEINLLSKRLDVKKNKLEVLLKKYSTCLHKDYTSTSNIISGRVLINNVGADFAVNTIIIDDDFENNISQEINQSTDIINPEIVNESYIDQINNLIDVSLEIENNNLENNSKSFCDNIRNDILNLREDIKAELLTYKELIKNNQKNISQLDQLMQEKNALLKECNANYYVDNCENEINLLENKKKDLFSLINNGKSPNYSNQEYLKYREDYFLIESKINYLKEVCKKQETININCQEKQNIVSQIENLNKEYLNSSVVENSYAIKRKINYLATKLENIVCDQDLENDFEIVTQQEKCLINLKNTNLSEEEINNICLNKKNIEYQKKIDFVKNIDAQISLKDDKLKEINRSVTEIKEELNSKKNLSEKNEFIVKNINYIVQDTILKIENRILELEKSIEQIEMLDIQDELKDEKIKNLNNKIASLEIVKNSVLDVEDVDELKKVLSNARYQDKISRKSKNKNLILLELDYIERNILNKYFKNHPQYLKLLEVVETLKEETNSIDLESINLNDYYSVKEKVDYFKEDLRKY